MFANYLGFNFIKNVGYCGLIRSRQLFTLGKEAGINIIANRSGKLGYMGIYIVLCLYSCPFF